MDNLSLFRRKGFEISLLSKQRSYSLMLFENQRLQYLYLFKCFFLRANIGISIKCFNKMLLLPCTIKLCLAMFLFRDNLNSQVSHLYGLLSSWTSFMWSINLNSFAKVKVKIQSEWIYETINFAKNNPKNLKDFCPMYYKNSQGRNSSIFLCHFSENWWFHTFIPELSLGFEIQRC